MPIRLTRQGFRLALLIGIVGFAAYNNQNNLLYVMTSVGLASLLVGLFAGWWSLRGLSVVRASHPDAYAGVAFREKLVVAASRSAFGLSVEDRPESIPYLAAGGGTECDVERLYRRRGRYRASEVVASTGFPFGFFHISRKLSAPRDILVFPRIRAVDSALVRAEQRGRLPRVKRRGQGDEFFRLRDYVPGDHIHHIHWKTSAKAGEVLVREFGEENEERLTVGFVDVLPAGRDPAELEHLVSATASLVSHLSQSGVAYGFLAANLELPPSSSKEHTRRILTYLADVEASSDVDAGLVAKMDAADSRGEMVLVVALDEKFPAGTKVVEPRRLFRRGPPSYNYGEASPTDAALRAPSSHADRPRPLGYVESRRPTPPEGLRQVSPKHGGGGRKAEAEAKRRRKRSAEAGS